MSKNVLTFLAIADTGSITAAAERLNITQPTLTKRLQQLEAGYDCKLVERLPRGVKLTKFGEQLLPYARRIKHEHQQSLEAIQSVKSGHLDEFRVGAGPLFQLRYLGTAFDRLIMEFPGTAMRLTADVNSRTLPKLREGNLDVVFGTMEFPECDGQVEFRKLTNVEQGLIIGANHPAAQNSTINIRELSDIPWIVYSDTPENEEMLLSYFSTQGLPPPKFVLQTTSYLLGFQMVADSNYAMVLPVQLEPILDLTKLRVLRTDPPIGTKPAGAYVRHSSVSYPIISRLIEIVAELAEH